MTGDAVIHTNGLKQTKRDELFILTTKGILQVCLLCKKTSHGHIDKFKYTTKTYSKR